MLLMLLLLYYIVILTVAYFAASYLFAHDDCSKMNKNTNNGNLNKCGSSTVACNKAHTQDVNGLHLFSQYLECDANEVKQQADTDKTTAEEAQLTKDKVIVNQSNSLFSKHFCNSLADVKANTTSHCYGNADNNDNKKMISSDINLKHLPDHIQRKLTLLEQTCTPLPVCGQEVRVLHTPSAFYEEMKLQINQATRSIVMTALYIGEGPLSTAFVKCLEDKIVEEAHKRAHQTYNKENEIYSPFTVTLLLDYNRMQCGNNLNTIRNLLKLAIEFDRTHSRSLANTHNDANTVTMNEANGEQKLELSHKHNCETKGSHVRVSVYLFQSPNKWNSLFGRFSRAKEALGVQHTKLFIFDGQNTILTGANLSDDYFASRMDRYIVFERNVFVAQWFSQLADALTDISHPIIDNCNDCTTNTTPTSSNTNDDIDYDNLYNQKATLNEDKNNMESNSSKQNEKHLQVHSNGCKKRNDQESNVNHTQHNCLHSAQTSKLNAGKVTLHQKSNLLILPNVCGFDPSCEVERYIATAQERIMSFVHKVTVQFKHTASQHFMCECKCESNTTNSNATNKKIYDTLLFPTLQMGRLDIWHDTRVMQSLLQRTSCNDHLYLTSPYLNLYGDYTMTLLTNNSSPYQLDCITASVESNGWNGQRGLAGYIPFFYLQLERAFYFLAKSYNALDRIHVREFAVAGLSFHAKGIWFTISTTSAETKPNKNKVAKNDMNGISYDNNKQTLQSCEKSNINNEHVECKCNHCENSSNNIYTVNRNNVNSSTDKMTEHDCSTNNNNTNAEIVSSPVEMINPLSAEEQERIQPPYLVAYGSTNYGYRSVFKDVESEAFLFTLNTELQSAQRNDLLYLLQESLPVHENRFRGKAKGRFQPVISLLAQLGQDFL